jgi:hypothetical protein
MALYDPQEFPAETRTDFSLSEILAWARMKPADEAYRYTSSRDCAVCQFLRETGRCRTPSISSNRWYDYEAAKYEPHYFDDRIDTAANWASVNNEKYNGTATFAEFADELEKVLSA